MPDVEVGASPGFTLGLIATFLTSFLTTFLTTFLTAGATAGTGSSTVRFGGAPLPLDDMTRAGGAGADRRSLPAP